MGKTKRWKWKQAVFLAGVLLCVICTTCTGCGERAQAEEQGELVRKEAVGEIRQPYLSALFTPHEKNGKIIPKKFKQKGAG